MLTPTDLNGDGLVDMVLGNANGKAEVWMNPGMDAGLGTAATFELPSSDGVTDIELADVNKDGLDDLVMVIGSTGTVRTIIDPGTPGTPSSIGAAAIAWSTQPFTDVAPPNTPRQVEAADVNKDGHVDLVVGTSANAVIYLGDATSTSTGSCC